MTLGFTLAELGSYHMVAGTAIAFVLVSAGAHLDHHRRLAMLALTAVYVPLAITLHRMGSPEGVSGFVVFYLVATMGWCVGSWLRSTREAEAERRRASPRPPAPRSAPASPASSTTSSPTT